MPILNNPYFPQRCSHQAYTSWAINALQLFHKLFHSLPWKHKTFEELQTEYHLPNNHLYYFHQITSHWKQLHLPSQWLFSNSFLDTAISSKQYSISTICPKLQLLFLKKVDSSSLSHWWKDFPEITTTNDFFLGYARISRTTTRQTLSFFKCWKYFMLFTFTSEEIKEFTRPFQYSNGHLKAS